MAASSQRLWEPCKVLGEEPWEGYDSDIILVVVVLMKTAKE